MPWRGIWRHHCEMEVLFRRCRWSQRTYWGREEKDTGVVQGNSVLRILQVSRTEALGIHSPQLYCMLVRFAGFVSVRVFAREHYIVTCGFCQKLWILGCKRGPDRILPFLSSDYHGSHYFSYQP